MYICINICIYIYMYIKRCICIRRRSTTSGAYYKYNCDTRIAPLTGVPRS